MRVKKMCVILFLLLFIISLVGSVLPVAAEPQEELPVVRVGTLALPGYLLVWYLDQQGYDLDVGIDVQYTIFASGPPMMDALAAGKLDMGCLGSVPPLTSAAAGTSVTYVIDMHEDTTSIMSILARPGIKTMLDLKGKTIAFPFGTGMHFFTELALRKYGMTMDDVVAINMSPAEASYAFLSGAVDAVCPFGGYVFPLLEAGYWPIFWGWSLWELGAPGKSDAPIIDVKLGDVIVASRTFANEHPDLVVKFLSAFYRAVDDHQKSKRTVFQAMLAEQARLLGISFSEFQLDAWLNLPMYENRQYDEEKEGWYIFSLEEELELFEKGTIYESFSAMADFYYDAGTIDRKPDPKEFVKDTFIEALVNAEKLALTSIQSTEQALKEASEAGGNVSEVYDLLIEAKTAYAQADYPTATELADNARSRAIEIRDATIAGRNMIYIVIGIIVIIVIALLVVKRV